MVSFEHLISYYLIRFSKHSKKEKIIETYKKHICRVGDCVFLTMCYLRIRKNVYCILDTLCINKDHKWNELKHKQISVCEFDIQLSL